jgi:hypothetical protein
VPNLIIKFKLQISKKGDRLLFEDIAEAAGPN